MSDLRFHLFDSMLLDLQTFWNKLPTKFSHFFHDDELGEKNNKNKKNIFLSWTLDLLCWFLKQTFIGGWWSLPIGIELARRNHTLPPYCLTKHKTTRQFSNAMVSPFKSWISKKNNYLWSYHHHFLFPFSKLQNSSSLPSRTNNLWIWKNFDDIATFSPKAN